MASISTMTLFAFIVNIIFGSGVFINSFPLYGLLGRFSFLVYGVVGILMFPLVLILYFVGVKYPGKSIFSIFDDTLSRKKSIVLILSYAVTKVGSVFVALRFITSNALEYLNIDNRYTIILFFGLYLFLFFLVYCNYSINRILQWSILGIKLLPVTFLFLFLLIFSNIEEIVSFGLGVSCSSFGLASFFQGCGVAIFSFMGCETLLVSSQYFYFLKDKIAKIILFAFTFSVLSYALYQGSFSYFLCQKNIIISDVRGFFYYTSLFNDSSFVLKAFFTLFCCALVIAALGSALGIFFTVVRALQEGVSALYSSQQKSPIKNLMRFEYCAFFYLLIFPLYFLLDSYLPFFMREFSSLGTLITYGALLYAYAKNTDYSRLLFFMSLLSMLVLFVFHLYSAFYLTGCCGYASYILFFLTLYYCLVNDKSFTR
jgi:hypothetical protein